MFLFELCMRQLTIKKIQLTLAAFLCIWVTSFSQYTAADYTPLKSSGLIPDLFLQSAKTMSEDEIRLLQSAKTAGQIAEDKKVKEDKSNFIKESNYYLRRTLLSGNVLINDPLGIYVNKVADNLLKNNPELRASLHIFVIKSTEVNAHAYDKGVILVNVGLLAQLENEAQLAYILSHEIAHVIKKHSVSLYVERAKFERTKNDNDTYDSRIEARFTFSKENESEADMVGLNLLKATGYSIKAVDGAFDVLQYSYLPFELVDFKKSFFEDEYLTLPDTFFLKKTADIKSNDNYDDSKSTHPNIRKRRSAIAPELNVNDEADRKHYIVSEEEFKNVRETARFELCRLYLLERSYVSAIYASYILLNSYPDNFYLKKTIAKALYNLIIYKSPIQRYKDQITLPAYRDYSVRDYKKIEGPSQGLFYTLGSLNTKELNTIALWYTYKLHKAYPADLILNNLTDSLFSEMIYVNELYLNDFSKLSKAELKALDTIKVADSDPDSKYSTIKSQRIKSDIASDKSFILYAFAGLLKDDEFTERYLKIAHGLNKKREPKPLSVAEQKVADKEARLALDRPRNAFLGIDKVILPDPFYKKSYLDGKNDNIDYYETEDNKNRMIDIQKKCLDKLQMNYHAFSSVTLQANDIEKYNTYSVLNEWMNERFKHGSNNDAVVTVTDDVKKVIDQLGCKYIVWNGIYNIKGARYRNSYYFALLNLENGTVLKYDTDFAKGNDYTDVVNELVYDSLQDLDIHIPHH